MGNGGMYRDGWGGGDGMCGLGFGGGGGRRGEWVR